MLTHAEAVVVTEVRTLQTFEELTELIAVFDTIWGTQPGRTMFDLNMLIALKHGGNYVAGAFAGDRIVGGSVGFFAEPLGHVLHSHIAGVRSDISGGGIGRRLKQHQRDWCLERGIGTIRWTFDPLIARNAHFNLNSLGAGMSAYIANCYGVMTDGINAGDESDRLVVDWALESAERSRPFTVDGAGYVLLANSDGRPVIDSSALSAETVAVQIPADIERMRLEASAQARSWRSALRDALEPLANSTEWRPVGFDSANHYVFTRR